MCWRTVSEMVALKCKSSDPDVGEHDSDLTTNGMHTVLSACSRNASPATCGGMMCTTYITKRNSSNNSE